MTPSLPLDPFTTAGAQHIAMLAGQQPAPMSASILSTPTMPTLPQPVEPPLPANPAIPSLDSILNTSDTPLDHQFDDATKSIANTEGDLATEGAYRTSQETANDLVGKRKTVTDLTTQLNNLAAGDQIPLQLQNAAEGRGITAAGLAPEQAAAIRNNTIKRQGVAAILNAANGNLATAQDQVDSAVKAKFDPLKAKVAAQQAQLAALTPLMDKEEKKQALLQKAQLDERARQLDKQEEDQKSIFKTMTDAASVGADALTLRKIQNADTPEEAASLAAPFLAKPYLDQQKQQQFDNNIKLATLAIEQRKAANDAAAATADPGQILAYAQQYAGTGNIPTGLPKGTFGLVSQVAQELPKPDGAIVSVSTGVVPSNVTSTQVDGLGALRDLTKKLDELKTSYQSTGLLSKTADRQRYASLNSEIVDLLARARSGAALTSDEVANYSSKIPQLLSITNILGANRTSTGLAKIDGLQKSISDKLNTSLSAHNATMYGYSKVNVGGQQYTVGQLITNDAGQTGRVNPDGSITIVQ